MNLEKRNVLRGFLVRSAAGIAAAVGLVAAMTSPASAADIITNWSFDDDFTATAGSAMNDLSQDTGTTTIGTSGGKIGAGYASFNGSVLKVGNPGSAYQLGEGRLSYSFWMRDTGTSVVNARITGTTGSSNAEGWDIWYNDGTDDVRAAVRETDGGARSAARSETTDINLNQWHLIVVNLDNTDGAFADPEIWIDGVRQAVTMQFDQLSEGADAIEGNTFFVGGIASISNYFVGDIDDLTIYDGPLDQANVDALWNDGDGAAAATVIPEPGSLGLVGLGALAMLRRRANKK